MIPAKIHYFWFGHNRKPKIVEKCINSWRKHLIDFEIIEWNENNYDINKTAWTRDTQKAKNWAYLSDYARIDILNQFGGIYLDTDEEIFNDITPFLKHVFFVGRETKEYIQAGLIGSTKNNLILSNILDYYSNTTYFDFFNKNLTLPILMTSILKNYGLNNDYCNQLLKNNIAIYSAEYFTIKSSYSYGIQHYYGSWKTNKFLSYKTRLNIYHNSFIKILKKAIYDIKNIINFNKH